MAIAGHAFASTTDLTAGKAKGKRMGAVTSRVLLERLVTFALLPVLLGWFLFVGASTLVDLRPRPVSLPAEQTYSPYLDDFVVFYAAGQLVHGGQGNKLYDLDTLRREEGQIAGSPAGENLVLPFFNPPYVALPLAVLSTLPLLSAVTAWTSVGLLVAAVCMLLLVRSRIRGREPVLLAVWGLGIITSLPFVQTLLHGQTSFFLLAGWTILWFGAFSSRRPTLAAAGLVVLSVKPQFVLVPVMYLVLDRQFRTIAFAASAVAAASVFAMLFAGWQIAPDYLRLLLHAATWDDTKGISTYGMFGWNAFSRALLEHEPIARLPLTVALDLLTLAGTFAFLRFRTRRAPEHVFGVVVFAALLVSSHLYAHDVLVAALPLLLLGTSANRVEAAAWSLFALSGWGVLYFHFDLLSSLGVNVTCLWLAMGGAIAGLGWERIGSLLGSLTGRIFAGARTPEATST